ncbi:helix-turn-helix transcriptional regulator [Promicromonospora sp. MEB111]|uniref:helix-turn-helix domain-containing protein n=1 Tax=Promicromonospora sp. MEB111 TaxID=3040301 RepID=UPI00254DABE9|nr:helix-turn-helix transcriptional regulator [Promicromonospora sp. MEB111]
MSGHTGEPEPSWDRGAAGPPLREQTNPLGAYLRARRELVTPRQAGLPEAGTRRVPGLRREEVAMLAGISADYYLRLERGRDRNPSVQVLESLARVLHLDDDHFAHLLTLVADAPGQRARQRGRGEETLPDGARKLLDSLVQPAFVEGRYFDVVASNALARAVDPRLDVGGNQLRDLFLDPSAQALYPEWENVTECFVASLRQSAGTDLDDPRFVELVGQLSASARFRDLWARHEVRGQRGTPLRIDHPQVGELTVNRERLGIGGAEHLMLVVYHPDSGSDDAGKLALLASASAHPASATANPVEDGARVA